MIWVEKARSLRVRNHRGRGRDRHDYPGGPAANPCPGSGFGGKLVRFLIWAAAVSGAVLSCLSPRLLLADGGTLRVSNVPMGAYRVYVFTDPTPIPPDTLDVSVLVTFERGRGLATGLEILVVGRHLDAPGPEVTRAATREQADDPRYYAAHFSLGSKGRWELEVRLRGPEGEGKVRFEVEVLEPSLGDSPFFILGLALVPLILVGWWLRRSGGPPAPPEALESGPRDP